MGFFVCCARACDRHSRRAGSCYSASFQCPPIGGASEEDHSICVFPISPPPFRFPLLCFPLFRLAPPSSLVCSNGVEYALRCRLVGRQVWILVHCAKIRRYKIVHVFSSRPPRDCTLLEETWVARNTNGRLDRGGARTTPLSRLPVPLLLVSSRPRPPSSFVRPRLAMRCLAVGLAGVVFSGAL